MKTSKFTGEQIAFALRQPSLVQRLNDPTTKWRALEVSGWYGQGTRLIEIVSGTAL